MLNPLRLVRSFRHAFRGLYRVFQEERNFRIQSIFLFVVIILSLWFKISWMEFIIVIFACAFLLILEIVNTVLEKFQDVVKPRVHHYIEFIKDAMAGAVLLAALTSSVIFIVIFLPHIVIFLNI